MQRDISGIVRNLEKKQNNDIIYKKDKIKKMFLEDPDLLDVLGKPEKRPLNKYVDPKHPTEEELSKRQEILNYNEKLDHDQIVPFLKLNGIQTDVMNYIMFDIEDDNVSYSNQIIKNQQLTVIVVIHENDIYTEYNILRTDLVDYIIRDLLCWTNVLGMQVKLTEDKPMILDGGYYSRRIRFKIETPNVVNTHMGMSNKYDRFK